MNWIQENKFLSVLIGVTVIGAALLIFLLMGARTGFTEASEQYEQQTAELQRLQRLKPYPEAANLKLLTDLRDAHATEVQQLRDSLGKMELPMEQISPEQFQDLLRSQVSEIQALAKENGVTLPEGFYLGFAEYQGSPPRGEATQLLGWELKSIVSVVRTLLISKVASIDSIQREPLPQESGAAPKSPDPRGGRPPRGPGGNQPDQAQQLIKRYPFTIAFTCEQSRFRSVLNQITNTKEQFFIPRTLKIENEQVAGPAREPAAAPAAAGETPDAGAESLQSLIQGSATPEQAQEAAKTLSFIVGVEKVKVIVTIDIVDFAMPGQSKETEAAAR